MRSTITLQAHLEKHKQMLSASVPEKHAHRPEEYRSYLKREIARTQKKLDELAPQVPK